MALSSDLSNTKGFDPRLARARNKRHLYDLRKSIVGPVPVHQFIEQFLGGQSRSGNEDALLCAKNTFKAVPLTASISEEISEPLLAALNKQTAHQTRCPGFVFENTARRSLHPTSPGYAKPHISCFAKRNIENVRHSSRRSRSELGYAELLIQVTADATRDIFVDPPPDLDAERRASFNFLQRRGSPTERTEDEDALGLHIAFVTEVFGRQRRLAFFSISLAGSRARLFRWDRSGCLVSEAFDIREQPEALCEFLRRFSQTSDIVRGHDPTIFPATLEEELRFRDAVKEHVRAQLDVEGEALDRALSQHYKPGHAAIVEVYPQHEPLSEDDVQQFIVSRPVVSPLSLTGRGTQGFWAVDCATSCVVFLKDTWRVAIEAGADVVEGDVLAHLTNIGVRNVPSFVAHGDVPGYVPGEEEGSVASWQSSSVAKFAKGFAVCRIAGEAVSLTDVQRYRLVMGDVGYGLSTFRGTEELLHATYDAFTAMRDALSKDSRIHRDVSVGNIILVRVPGQEIRRGYLIDWETSVRVDDAGKAISSGRVGTWYFMSWRMLDHQEARGKHTFLDDMESLVHIVFYCALLFLPHALPKERLMATFHDYFEQSVDFDPAHGGDCKCITAHNQVVIKKAGIVSTSLVKWLTTMLQFQCPPGWNTFGYRFGEHWTPERVDAFWSEFLRAHTLERDNRFVHDISKEEQYDDVELSASPPSMLPSPTPPPPPARKRPARHDPSAGTPDRKRRRSMRLQAARATTSSPAPAAPHPTDGPRRSQRVKTISTRAQAPSAAPLTTAPRATRTATQRTAGGRGRGRPRQ